MTFGEFHLTFKELITNPSQILPSSPQKDEMKGSLLTRFRTAIHHCAKTSNKGGTRKLHAPVSIHPDKHRHKQP